jgi:hypothetical protein
MNTFGNPLAEYNPQMEAEAYEYPQFEREWGEAEGAGEAEGVFNEQLEMELTAELLEVTNEQELEQFLGDLIKKAGSAIGKFAKSDVGKSVFGVLKSVASKALPIAGGAVGTFFGGPIGATIGSNLAGMAGSALGLELEGLSQEDREFEAAKQFVKFAGETMKNAVEGAPNADPAAVAHAAAVEAARSHAPGILSGLSPTANRSGRWVRRRGAIVLYGV